jgi:hypothetical protein
MWEEVDLHHHLLFRPRVVVAVAPVDAAAMAPTVTP